MTIELQMLTCSIILGLVQLFLQSGMATRHRDLQWNLGPRDKKMPDLPGVAGRIERAQKNFLETFPFFLGAVFLVTVTNANSALTALGAQLYFWGRLAYVPAYALGIPVLRTIVWAIAMVGIGLMLAALF